MSGTQGQYKECGAHVYSDGVTFRVWAPFADSVSVVGDFNNWKDDATPMLRQDDSTWFVDVTGATAGQEYNFVIMHQGEKLQRNDPCALQLTAAGTSSVVVDPDFDWGDDSYRLPPLAELVLYELHVGTFVRSDPAMPGTFAEAATRLDYLADLGVNAVEIMPCNSMWTDTWWGYTPDNLYAIEASYGGRRSFQEFVKAAHQRGIGVILDVVYNHLNSGPYDLWQFDGWSQDGYGGIYFYNDARARTPWGQTRPDYGRLEVRKFITNNTRMWLHDCHVDGLRVDATLFIRNIADKPWEHPEQELPDGWKMLQEITSESIKTKPRALLIAEDLQNNAWITKPVKEGGAGFTTQWDASFSGILRDVLNQPVDESRDLEKMRFALTNSTNGNPFERVIFSESHDTDAQATGGKRLDEAIDPGNAGGMYARKRATLAAGLLMTLPGIPMLFQGQEFEEDGAFTHYGSLDWSKTETFQGLLRLHQHLVALRKNAYGNTAGLMGKNIDLFHVDNINKLLAYHRWHRAGPGDNVVVVANFANQIRKGYGIAFPGIGTWWVRFNSDWKGYSLDFSDITPPSVEAKPDPNDSQKLVGSIDIGPYAVFIISQDV